jgi:hypothetical protein
MSNKNVHTVKDGGRWSNKQNGKVISSHNNQANAIEAGRKEAINDRVEHVIHGRDGKIRDKNSYGNDQRNILG